jgi:hypothetical protein
MTRLLDRLGPQPIEGEVLPRQQSSLVPVEQFMAQIVAHKNEIAERIDRLTEDIDGLENRRGRMIAEAQLELGRMLIEARHPVESGEAGDEAAINWWEYFGDHAYDISRSHAERWMAIAAKADPKAAAIAYRARDAAYHRDYRQREKLKTIAPPPSDVRWKPEPAPSISTTPPVEMEAEAEPDEDDQVQWDHSEPEPEPKPEPLPKPPKLTRDPLAEAVILKRQILDLMKMMRPIERTEFRRALIEDVEAMERSQ